MVSCYASQFQVPGASRRIASKGFNMDITTNFTILKWEEESFSELEGAAKLTSANVEYQYSGPLSGTSVVKYIMAYDSAGGAIYHGLERVVGELNGCAGSFVLQHQGVFQDGKIDQKSIILDNSGSGQLRGISGSASLQTGHQDSYCMDLSYRLPE